MTLSRGLDPAEPLDRSERRALTERLLRQLSAARDDDVETTDLEEQVIRINMPVARDIARRFENRGIAREDLCQVAYLGLVKAVRRHDAQPGHDFLTFAVPTIRGELRRWFRDGGWMVRPPRSVQELQPRIRTAEEDLAQRVGRTPHEEEIATELDLSPTQVRRARAAEGCFHPTSLDAGVAGSEDDRPVSLGDRIGATDPGFDQVEARAALAPVWRALSAKERSMVELWLFQDVTQAEIGRRIGVTQTQVSRLIAAALARMRGQLEGIVPTPRAA